MSRAAPLAKLASLLLLTAIFPACERSATAPTLAPTLAPSLDVRGHKQEARLEAPAHDGGAVARTVGRSGGHVRFHDASARGIEYELDIPAGALKTETAISMTVLGDGHYDVELSAQVDGKEVGDKGFRQPLRLTFSYATAKHPAPPPHLAVACVLPDGSFQEVKTQANPGRKTLTGYLPHFSKWTIIAW